MWNILRRNGQNLTRFYIYIAIGKLYVGIGNLHICMFVTESRPLIEVGGRFSCNILGMVGQGLTKFCIHIIINKIYV